MITSRRFLLQRKINITYFSEGSLGALHIERENLLSLLRVVLATLLRGKMEDGWTIVALLTERANWTERFGWFFDSLNDFRMNGFTIGVRGLEAHFGGGIFCSGVSGTIQVEDLRFVASVTGGSVLITLQTPGSGAFLSKDLGVWSAGVLRSTGLDCLDGRGGLTTGGLTRLLKLGEYGTVSLGFGALATWVALERATIFMTGVATDLKETERLSVEAPPFAIFVLLRLVAVWPNDNVRFNWACFFSGISCLIITSLGSSLSRAILAFGGAFLLLNVPVRASKEETLSGFLKLRPSLINNFCFLASRFSSIICLIRKILMVLNLWKSFTLSTLFPHLSPFW